MRIIAHKSNLFNTEEFIRQTLSSNAINGISIDITITKDNQIAVLNLVSENNVTLQNLQDFTLSGYSQEALLTLEDILEPYKNTNKKIVINFFPLVTGQITDATIKDINDRYENYVRIATEVLKKYAYMDLYLCSANEKAIYFLKQYATFAKIGIVVVEGSFSYQDVDFYVFLPNFLDENIFTEQLNRGKEIMIAITTSSNLNTVWRSFANKNKDPKLARIFNETYFINDYPEIFYNLFAPLQE